MNLAAELLVGSSRIDQWRKEIATTINLVTGFLTDADYASVDLKNETLLDESDSHRWMIRNFPDGLKFFLFSRDYEKTEAFVCELPGNRIPLENVGFVHSCLDPFVRGMSRLFPSLDSRWRSLLQTARYEFRMYYELNFLIPSDNPHDGKEGKLVEFRKKSDLTFPLPLNTEVFVSLEGEPGKDTGCFFVVSGYQHQISDIYGDLNERQFSMILKPQEGWEDVGSDATLRHLLEVNGWEQINV